MPLTITMPALSPTMTEGRIARWLVKEGDSVAPGDVLAEIETDKATMELEADEEGVVGSIMVAEGGDAVPVNTPIATILADGEDAAPPEAAPVTAPEQESSPQPPVPEIPTPAAPAAPAPASTCGRVVASPVARRLAKEKGLELSAIQGSGPGGRIVKEDVEAASMAPVAAPVAAPAPVVATEPKASPLAGRMAAQAGIDLATLAGSGADGKIVKADIDAALGAGAEIPPAPVAPTASPAPATVAPAAGDTEIPLSLMRKTIARRLTESKQTVPHFYQLVECDIERLNGLLEELNSRDGADYKLTINDFLVRALALALKAFPDVNTSWGETVLLQHNSVDVAVAVATEGGLITPIVRQADHKGLAEISATVRELAGRARQGKLMPEEYQGGSFTISNLGMFGITEFSAIINPPQSGIVAVGVGEQRPLVRDGALAIAALMTCTFSFDHRVVDGVLGAHFVNAFKGFVEDPLSMLL